MAAKGVAFIINILIIILLVQQHATNSFYSLFLQHLNFSPSELGFVRGSQMWMSVLMVPAWMFLTRECLTAQGKRIVIAICVIVLISLYITLVFIPPSMSCLITDVTHCHLTPSLNGISKDTQRLAAVNFNNISVFNQSSKGGLLFTEFTTSKQHASVLTNLKDLHGKRLSNHSQESSTSSEPKKCNTSIMPYNISDTSTEIIHSLTEFNCNYSKNLSNGSSKKTFFENKWPLHTLDEGHDIPQDPERKTSTTASAIYDSLEFKNVVVHNIASDKLKGKILENNKESVLYHHNFINKHNLQSAHKTGRKKHKFYSNPEAPASDLNQYYSETTMGNSEEKNTHTGEQLNFDKFKPILDLISYRHKAVRNNNIHSLHYKNERLLEPSNQDLNVQMPNSAALSKAHKFINAPHTILSKKKHENEENGFKVNEQPNTVPNLISSFNIKHHSHKSPKAILPNKKYEESYTGQSTNKIEEDLRRMTSLQMSNQAIQKTEKLKTHLTKEKALYSIRPNWKKQSYKRSVHSIIQVPQIKHISKRHSKRIKSKRQVHKTPKAHNLKTLCRNSTHKWQNKKARRSKTKDEIQIKYYTLRSLKSVADFNDSYKSRTENDNVKVNDTKITRYLSSYSNGNYLFSFGFFLVLAEIFSRGITSVCRRMCTENVTEDPHIFNFGLQQWAMKIWGIVICPLLMTIVIKVTCTYQPRVFFIVAAFLLMINIPIILFTLPASHKTQKEMSQKDKKFKSSIGSQLSVLVSGFGTACNFEFFFWHINMQQKFAFNYQLLYCSYLSLRAIAQTSVQPSVQHWQEEHIINERRTRALWSIGSHAALGLHSLGASFLRPTWILTLLGLLLGCSDSFQNSETASVWWTIGYGFGCLLGGYMVNIYGTEFFFQGVAAVMFTFCILESACYGFSNYNGCGCKRKTVYSKVLLLPEGEDFSEEEEEEITMEEGDDWLERALQKDELKQKQLECVASV